MKYAVSICMLGYTRIQGVTCFDSETKEFLEITPATVRRLIDQGQVKGIKWKNGEDGTEFVCDVDNWNQKNIPVKTACGKFRPLLNDYPGVQVNSMYTLVRVLDTDYRGRLYEVVSNKCCRVKITEDNLRKLASITDIAGCWIGDDKIDVASGVVYEDRRADSKEQVISIREKKQEPVKEATCMEDVFSNLDTAMLVQGNTYEMDGLEKAYEEENPVSEEEALEAGEKTNSEEEETQNVTAEAANNKKTTSKSKNSRNKKSS